MMADVVFLVSDGTSVNPGSKNSLIKLSTDKVLCAGFGWCYLYRLKWTVKDTLSECINPIATNLQNLHYAYEKSSEKSPKLKEVYKILKQLHIFKSDDVKPQRATGTNGFK